MNEMPYVEKMGLPYTLLLDPATGRAAAYNQTHRLITEVASAQLVEWGKSFAVQTQSWNAERHSRGGDRMPLPAWATPEVLARAVVMWVRRGSTEEQVLRAMPRR